MISFAAQEFQNYVVCLKIMPCKGPSSFNVVHVAQGTTSASGTPCSTIDFAPAWVTGYMASNQGDGATWEGKDDCSLRVMLAIVMTSQVCKGQSRSLRCAWGRGDRRMVRCSVQVDMEHEGRLSAKLLQVLQPHVQLVTCAH